MVLLLFRNKPISMWTHSLLNFWVVQFSLPIICHQKSTKTVNSSTISKFIEIDFLKNLNDNFESTIKLHFIYDHQFSKMASFLLLSCD